MANIAWVTKRREDVSQILVDSLQKLGNANATLLRGQILEQSGDSRYNVAVQTSSFRSPCNSPKESSSNQSQSSASPTRLEFENVVPKLDIESLQKLAEGCQSLGQDCEYFCLNCGRPAPESPSSDKDAISVLSANTNTSTKLISRGTSHNQNYLQSYDSSQSENSAKQNKASSFILDNLGFTGTASHSKCDPDVDKTRLEVESNIIEGSGGSETSVISICLADPDEFSRENETERTSEDSLDRMTVPPLILTKKTTPAPSPPTPSPASTPQQIAAEAQQLLANTRRNSKSNHGQSAPSSEHSYQQSRASSSSPSDSRGSKGRRQSFGFNLKLTPGELADAMPPMYRRKRNMRQRSRILNRFLRFFGFKQKGYRRSVNRVSF